MGLRIRTNVASLNAQRRLGVSTDARSESMNKLSSGARINKAADDAAGLAISENLRADIRSLNQAKRNALDGISLVQTAEGGLIETTNMLIRLRELSVQAASDTVGRTERGFLDKEYQQLKNEIDRIAMSTEFNGNRLLIGGQETGTDLDTGYMDFPAEIQVSKDYYVNADSFESENPVNIIRVDLQNINAMSTGDNSFNLDQSMDGSEINGIEFKQEAKLSIGRLDQAIEQVNEHRAYLGAIQNRLSSTIQNLGVQTENLDIARSRIADADYAAETANYTKNTILQSAGTSALAQANQQPMVALSLLNSL